MAKGVTGGRSGAGAATAKRGWGRAVIRGVVTVSLFIMFSGLIVYAYNKGKEAGGGDRPPIIKAGPAPYKVRPDRPGGMQVLNRDKQVYSQIDGSPKPPVVDWPRASKTTSTRLNKVTVAHCAISGSQSGIVRCANWRAAVTASRLRLTFTA